jgi:hypothetical protein
MECDAVTEKLPVILKPDEFLTKNRKSHNDPVHTEIERVDDGVEGKDGHKKEAGEDQAVGKELFASQQCRLHVFPFVKAISLSIS